MRTRRQRGREGQRGRGSARMPMLALCALALFCVMPRGTQGQQPLALDAPRGTSLHDKLASRATIALRDASLLEWLFAIQEEWGVDIVAGNELQDEVVSGAFTEATLRDVLTSILYARGYGFRQVGNSLLVTPLDEMTIKPGQQTALLALDLLDASEIEASVRLLLSPDGKIQAIPSSKSLFLVDTADAIQQARLFLKEAEANAQAGLQRERGRQQRTPTTSPPAAPPTANSESGGFVEIEEHARIFETQYVAADSLAEALRTLLVNARVSTFGSSDGLSAIASAAGPVPPSLVGNNKIVVVADRHGLDAAAKFIQQADAPRRQVRITAYMYDVAVESLEQLGINWSHAVKGRINGSGDPLSLYAYESRTFPLPVAVPTPAAGGAAATAADAVTAAVTPSATGSLMTLQYLSDYFDLTTLIQLFEENDGARLLARPNIVAYDGTQAHFSSVQEIPVQQLTQTEQGGNIGTTEFREAGITLRVTPRITNFNTVVLEVTPEFSLLNGFSANGQPIIDRRQATTKLELRDGESAVIGGLVRRNEIEIQRGVPGLMNLKYIGKLFRDHETTVTESELVVFIRAEIVGPSFPGDPRDLATYATVNDLLEQIPCANPAPVLPSCGDPHCPYHNPRPRFVAVTPDNCSVSQQTYSETSPPSFAPVPARANEWQPPLPNPIPEQLPSPGDYQEPSGHLPTSDQTRLISQSSRISRLPGLELERRAKTVVPVATAEGASSPPAVPLVSKPERVVPQGTNWLQRIFVR